MSLGIVVAVVDNFDPQTPPPPGTPFKEKAKWHVKKKKLDMKASDAARQEQDAPIPMAWRGCWRPREGEPSRGRANHRNRSEPSGRASQRGASHCEGSDRERERARARASERRNRLIRGEGSRTSDRYAAETARPRYHARARATRAVRTMFLIALLRVAPPLRDGAPRGLGATAARGAFCRAAGPRRRSLPPPPPPPPIAQIKAEALKTRIMMALNPAALAAAAKEAQSLKKKFDEIDVDGSGELDEAELKVMLTKSTGVEPTDEEARTDAAAAAAARARVPSAGRRRHACVGPVSRCPLFPFVLGGCSPPPTSPHFTRPPQPKSWLASRSPSSPAVRPSPVAGHTR